MQGRTCRQQWLASCGSAGQHRPRLVVLYVSRPALQCGAQVYKLFTESHAKATSKQRITRFFKPAAAPGCDAAIDTAADGGQRGK